MDHIPELPEYQWMQSRDARAIVRDGDLKFANLAGQQATVNAQESGGGALIVVGLFERSAK
jgi:hypothetical protein